MLQVLKSVRDLNCEFSRGCKNNGLNLLTAKQFLFTQVLNNWKSKPQRFAWTCQVSRNYVLTTIDMRKAVLLYWKQTLYAFLDKVSHSLLSNFWVIFEVTSIVSLRLVFFMSLLVSLAIYTKIHGFNHLHWSFESRSTTSRSSWKRRLLLYWVDSIWMCFES